MFLGVPPGSQGHGTKSPPSTGAPACVSGKLPFVTVTFHSPEACFCSILKISPSFQIAFWPLLSCNCSGSLSNKWSWPPLSRCRPPSSIFPQSAVHSGFQESSLPARKNVPTGPCWRLQPHASSLPSLSAFLALQVHAHHGAHGAPLWRNR